jgi:hypothetical protein
MVCVSMNTLDWNVFIYIFITSYIHLNFELGDDNVSGKDQE